MKTRIAVALFSICLVNPPQTPAQAQQPSSPADPEIVRISRLEGDVRIARGSQSQGAAGAAWEVAATNLPLRTGFILATGAGRAEVEFEDATILYLADNSVLAFDDLYTAGDVPHSALELLTGTASLYFQSFIAGAELVVKTPTDTLRTRYPFRGSFRIDSYADAMAVTPLDDGILHQPGAPQQAIAKGQTVFYRQGKRIEAPGTFNPAAFAEWDQWVAERIAWRAAAMANVMKASGLTEPIPGLAEMDGQGRFFDCGPYGTCWEPNAAGEQEQAGGSAAESQEASGAAAKQPARRKAAAKRPISAQANESGFPCYSGDMMDFLTDWATCYAGFYIQTGHRYVWVAKNKRHHHQSVQWVRYGHRVGFVPIHPLDVKGQPPINGKHEFFAVSGKDGLTVERVKVDPGHAVEVLASAPKEFQDAESFYLARADAPHMQAFRMNNAFSRNGDGRARTGGIPLSFDHKSQSFLMASQVIQGGKSVTVMQPVSNRGGDLQARGGGNSSGGSRGGSSGGSGSRSGGGSSGGGRGGSSGSSSSSGGGGHSGGGGGGYSGGGSSSSSSGSSSSSSSSSSSAGSSGGGGRR